MAAEALRELTAERIVARMTQETALHSRLQDQLREAEDEIAAAQERRSASAHTHAHVHLAPPWETHLEHMHAHTQGECPVRSCTDPNPDPEP